MAIPKYIKPEFDKFIEDSAFFKAIDDPLDRDDLDFGYVNNEVQAAWLAWQKRTEIFRRDGK